MIELLLTFRAGSAYCCGEWQCHFHLFPARRWDRLRQELLALGLEATGQLELRVEVVIEGGALFFAPNRLPRTPSELTAARAFNYRQTVTEGEYPDAEPGTAPDRCT